MDIKDLTARATETVRQFTEAEQEYSDNVQLRIDTSTGETDIADPEDTLEGEYYYIPMMDLVRFNPDGSLEPDADAIGDAVADYLTE